MQIEFDHGRDSLALLLSPMATTATFLQLAAAIERELRIIVAELRIDVADVIFAGWTMLSDLTAKSATPPSLP